MLSPAVLAEEELVSAYRTARSHPEVERRMTRAGASSRWLIYVLPIEWHLADIPLDPLEVVRRYGGHYTPQDFDRSRFKLLFTRARTHATEARARSIVTHTYGCDPVVLVEVDLGRDAVTGITDPPPHVIWGDIPTPLF